MLLDELVELVELLEDVLVELEDELDELDDEPELSVELSEDVEELSETLSVIDELISEVTFPEQPVHSSTAARINAADLIKIFFIRYSIFIRADVIFIVTYYTENVNKKLPHTIYGNPKLFEC